MEKILVALITLTLFSCKTNPEPKEGEKTGNYSGMIEYGNFANKILLQIEKDSTNFTVFFTSLEQNANRIPFQKIQADGDSINFMLQSDFYTYSFRNKWVENNRKLRGSLSVDTITVEYSLEKETIDDTNIPKSEEVSFQSNGFKLNGTIWHANNNEEKAMVIVTSSGNADRSASRAEAMLFSRLGFTSFHYDKRGTGTSEGNWQVATIEELASDDINAINYFSDKTGIALDEIGIKGSSQGAAKVPYILGELENLKYGIAVSCPGVPLLESDLNYWVNRNSEILGNDVEDATALQRKVFEFIAGKLSRPDLEKAIDGQKSKSWFSNVWVPNLEEVQTDKKLLYNPVPYFQTAKQPVLVLQGTLDEIIPTNSHEIISNALAKSEINSFRTILLEGASHSMYNIGKSDFPYWSKLHPKYLTTIEDWINALNSTK